MVKSKMLYVNVGMKQSTDGSWAFGELWVSTAAFDLGVMNQRKHAMDFSKSGGSSAKKSWSKCKRRTLLKSAEISWKCYEILMKKQPKIHQKSTNNINHQQTHIKNIEKHAKLLSTAPAKPAAGLEAIWTSKNRMKQPIERCGPLKEGASCEMNLYKWTIM